MMANLQEDFNGICVWCGENELFINETKTQYIVISSPHKRNADQNINLFFHNITCDTKNCLNKCTKLDLTNETKYLGYVIDSSWTHKKHIEYVVNRLRKLMPSLYKLKYLLNNKTKLILYYAWVESIIRCGIEVYGQASKTQVDRVQKVQNKIIQILFKYSNTIKTTDLYKKHKILNIRQLRDQIIISNNYFNSSYKKTTDMKESNIKRDYLQV